MTGKLWTLLTLCSLSSVRCVAPAEAVGSEPNRPVLVRLEAAHLPNAWRLHPQVISGGVPQGDDGFRQLARLGVKTLISVDGARPDVAAAARHRLRYVHLPHGYDGVPTERARQLAKAVRDLPGPVYIHCHHGRHRSPAAAVVGCVGAGLLPADAAPSVLAAAGTSPHYHGLRASALSARPIAPAQLDALRVNFQPAVAVPPLAKAMVEIEILHDRLLALEESRWQHEPGRPEAAPAHVALLLREQFVELRRTEDAAGRGDQFNRLLGEGEAAARRLERSLASRGASSVGEAAAALRAISDNCTACHRGHRD